MRKASCVFGVPKSVLHRRLSGGLTANASLGSKPVIPKEGEQRLHDHVIKLADLGFGIDWADIRSLAVKLASCAGIEHFVAGGGWLDGFKKRSPGSSSQWCPGTELYGCIKPSAGGFVFQGP